ncbi:MAG TPA: dihydrofolate reductase family protein [Acidimicrobiales bacterium]|nr:dihydrofolate reductase family protein [Acidimicrobiales bacterium]
MRIVVSEFTSLDGVVQAPGGEGEDPEGGFAHGGWSAPYFDETVMGRAIDEAMAGTDAMLFGRRTWQAMAAAWPEQAGDPFADRINQIPKYVASTTLTADDLTWANSRLLPANDVVGAIAELRATDGGYLMVWGSTVLVRTLFAHDLVDEVRLMIEPVVLGGGKRVFPDDGRMRGVELVDSVVAATGVIVCTYRTAAGGGA